MVADLLRSLLDMLKVHEAKVPLEAYVNQLDRLHDRYAEDAVQLASYSCSHWPTFRPHGSPSPTLLRPCPTNCHLHKLIISSTTVSTPVSTPPTSPSPFGGSGEEEEQNGSSSSTPLFGEIEGVYPYITMALPSKTELNLSITLKKAEDIHGLRRAEALVRQRYQELCSERTVVEQFSKRSSVVSVASMDEVRPLEWPGSHKGVCSLHEIVHSRSVSCPMFTSFEKDYIPSYGTIKRPCSSYGGHWRWWEVVAHTLLVVLFVCVVL